MVQLFVTRSSDKRSSYETELAERPKWQHGERRATEKAQSKIYQLLFMWRIEHEELQKQKIREQPGFVSPSRLGTNHSERIATEIKELTAARLARFSAINTSYGV